VKPTLPRACETEAFVWSNTTGWPEEPPAEGPGLRYPTRPTWRAEFVAFLRRLIGKPLRA
jgi:hypothetical protein